ncbi:hypothetical protein [Deinococcus sp. UYEF24]
MNKFSGLTSRKAIQPEPEAKDPPVSAAVQPQVVRMLGGRVPDPIFREFTYLKLSAEPELQVKRVTTEEALEAIVRALRDPEVRARWLEELRDVRRERRD